MTGIFGSPKPPSAPPSPPVMPAPDDAAIQAAKQATLQAAAARSGRAATILSQNDNSKASSGTLGPGP